MGPGPISDIGPGPMWHMGLAYYWQVRIPDYHEKLGLPRKNWDYQEQTEISEKSGLPEKVRD